MAVADLTVVPWYPLQGEKEGYFLVDEAIDVIKVSGLNYEVGAMSTTVEGSLEEILSLIPEIREAVFQKGGERVLITLRIDEKKTGPLTMESKVRKHRASKTPRRP